jgi:hypothetical protein
MPRCSFNFHHDLHGGVETEATDEKKSENVEPGIFVLSNRKPKKRDERGVGEWETRETYNVL